MRQVLEQTGRCVEQDHTSLGTDGFGLSDTREAVRRRFGVAPASIAATALVQPARTGAVPRETVAGARARYGQEG
jgi:pyruvate dehydrogenase E1 component